MTAQVVTIDFHVTCECNQECPYCWGPQGFVPPVDAFTAKRIISRVKEVGARRIVFTGGDPLLRPDIGVLIRYAKGNGLQVALSTTGDELTTTFLEEFGPHIDLVSLPLDGATEEVSARTKGKGHYAAVLRALDRLQERPQIDVKLCTPVTRHNVDDVPNIVRLAEHYARTTEARVFYNIFQAFPRSMQPREWGKLLVTDEEFRVLEQQLVGRTSVHINFLNHATLDRLYVMIFPDGSLVVPSGQEYLSLGQFLKIEDLNAVLEASRFDAAKHLRHSQGWSKTDYTLESPKKTSPANDSRNHQAAKRPPRNLAA